MVEHPMAFAAVPASQDLPLSFSLSLAVESHRWKITGGSEKKREL